MSIIKPKATIIVPHENHLTSVRYCLYYFDDFVSDAMRNFRNKVYDKYLENSPLTEDE